MQGLWWRARPARSDINANFVHWEGRSLPDAYTIRIFVPDGEPNGVRIIDRMNWTGVGLAFPRSKWQEIRGRNEFLQTGIYILIGYEPDINELPVIYVGQADGVGSRIDSHIQQKEFWDWCVVFVSSSSGLNRAHVTWLEYALLARANQTQRCRLDNGNFPQEPALSEAEKADTESFMSEIVRILPLVGLQVFEFPEAVATPGSVTQDNPESVEGDLPDTIVVPAQRDGFEEVFLGQDCWYAIRISGGMLDKIKYIAAYQSQPISAVTHFAPIDRIEPYGDGGKYRLIFSESASEIGPIPFGNAPTGAMQGPRYTTLAKLRSADQVADLF